MYFLLLSTMRGFKHFFATPPLKSNRLLIRGVGVQEPMRPGAINRPRGTGDYLFMYLFDAVWVAASELPVAQPAGTMMIWTPGTWQYYGNQDSGFRHSWIHCDGVVVQDLLRESGLPQNSPVRLANGAAVDRHLLGIYEELTQQPRPDAMIVRNLLDNMCREIARDLHPVDQRRQIPAELLAVRHLIESEYDRPLPLSELAAKSGHCVSHFCELFRRYFGTGAHEYLLRQRMHQAAYLLRDQNLAVKEVARRVGYADAYAFSKRFKEHFRASPTAFRHQEPAAGNG